MRFALFALCLFACTSKPVDDTDTDTLDLDAITRSERPSKRSEVYGVADEATNTLVVFGGNDGPIVNQRPKATYLDETWIFEPGAGWRQLDITGPSARARYGATHDATNGRALIFGGRWREDGASGDYDIFSDLWAFDFTTRTWSLLDDGGAGPSARTYASIAWDDASQTLYLFGGMTNASPMVIDVNMELWSWTASAGWNLQTYTGDVPSQRTFLGEAWDTKRKRLILFSGQVGDYWSLAYNDTYALDVGNGEWTRLNSGDGPATRMHPHAVYDGKRDRYILFGGHTDIGDGNDLWEMDPEQGEWRLMREADTFTGVGIGCMGDNSDVPADYVDQDLTAPERRHRGVFALMHDSLWIYGGMHAECSDHLDDTWRYPLQAGDWTELIEARSGESCARKDADCDCLCY
jgi:hypothetical protein